MSDLLYHVKRTIIRYDEDPSGATRDVDILGTFTDLAAAKAAANAGLAVSNHIQIFLLPIPSSPLVSHYFPATLQGT